MPEEEYYDEPPVVVQPTLRINEEQPYTEPTIVLWVPDVEQRRGWREYYIRKQEPKPKPGSMGFTHRKKRP